MHKNCVLDDGQSKSCSAHFAASSLVYAIEAFEEPWQMFWGNAHAIVTKRNATCRFPLGP